MDLYFSQKQCLDGFVSHRHSFLLHKMLIDGRVEWVLVNYCVVFISCFLLQYQDKLQTELASSRHC